MKNPQLVQILAEIADRYFDPEEGEAKFLIDEFSSHPLFVEGQERGHQDARAVLLGLADYFSVTELETAND